MNSRKETIQSLSRRDALKALAATGSALALSAVPDTWETPVVEVGTLPAFAATSISASFTNNVDVINKEWIFEGPPSGDPGYVGWLRAYEKPVPVVDGSGAAGASDWPPIVELIRRDISFPGGGAVLIHIRYRFISNIIWDYDYSCHDPYPQECLGVPVVGTMMRCYGLAYHKSDPTNTTAYIEGFLDKAIVEGNPDPSEVRIDFLFPIPAGYELCFTASFCSCLISLKNGDVRDVTGQVGPGIFGCLNGAC